MPIIDQTCIFQATTDSCLDIDRDSSVSPREATPDSDSGYTGAVTVSHTQNTTTFQNHQSSDAAAAPVSAPGSNKSSPSHRPHPPSFLGEMQALHRAKSKDEGVYVGKVDLQA